VSDFFKPADKLHISPDGTEMQLPGQTKPVKVIGPTPEQLRHAQQEQARRNAHMQRQIRSTFRCTECKRLWKGAVVRVVVRRIGGVQAEVLVCPDQTCDGAVILHQDALSLTNPPKDTGK
jgi:hypothetical protein